ncbi:MAG TPA: hypothetical protein VJN70_04910 [Gemmatimonadaceae bacterium]|nr:hypothetical protein [Gemmatimonadaceae bacterium]
MRIHVLLAASLGLLASCSDFTTAPNTDLGLFVWAEVSPSVVSASDSGATLHLRVYARNPSARTIRVPGGPPYVFSTDPATSKNIWGSLRIGNRESEMNAGPNVDWWGQHVYVFAPHETQYSEMIVTVHQWRSQGWSFASGLYRIRGWFNGHEGESAVLFATP